MDDHYWSSWSAIPESFHRLKTTKRREEIDLDFVLLRFVE